MMTWQAASSRGIDRLRMPAAWRPLWYQSINPVDARDVVEPARPVDASRGRRESVDALLPRDVLR